MSSSRRPGQKFTLDRRYCCISAQLTRSHASIRFNQLFVYARPSGTTNILFNNRVARLLGNVELRDFKWITRIENLLQKFSPFRWRWEARKCEKSIFPESEHFALLLESVFLLLSSSENVWRSEETCEKLEFVRMCGIPDNFPTCFLVVNVLQFQGGKEHNTLMTSRTTLIALSASPTLQQSISPNPPRQPSRLLLSDDIIVGRSQRFRTLNLKNLV